ncbi:hypothetical protein AAS21_gp187 [Pantoea phage vB_PagS_AAS21]|uniref:Uncharacterized protein n=1 Tax=Pantoea phage vB_PagS_AAS21 TaxID=2575261 RepID=A0A4Y5P1V7_9CAUD|nr:hypothetical protein AAS21_gp187 [Pantoea phage vB_PagS_AAS21]
MRMILIQLPKCEQFSFVFVNANDNH